MKENAEMKSCPFCAETIKAAAKICPFCQHRQSRFALLKKDVVVVILAIYFVGGIVMLAIVASNISDHPKAEFASHREDLEVERTSIERARQTADNWFANQGTNLVNVTWTTNSAGGVVTKVRADMIEVHFIDSQSNLIDVREPNAGALTAEPCLWLTGFITNRGVRGWNASELEVQFFDAHTNLIDVQHPSLDSPFRLGSHEERAFRLALNLSTPTNAGVFYKVRVQRADDVNNSE